MRVTALHKVGRQDGGRRRPQCAGRVSNLEPTIGLPPWYQERPGPAKTRGITYTWAADTPPFPRLLPLLLPTTLFYFLFLLPPFSPPPVVSPSPRLLPCLLSSLLFFRFLFFFRCQGTQLSGSFHHDAPTCPDVAVTFFHPLVLVLELSVAIP